MAVQKKFLKLKDVKRLAGVSGSKIYTMVEAKQFPEPIKIGHRSVRWIESEVRSWIADKVNRVDTTKPKDKYMESANEKTKPDEKKTKFGLYEDYDLKAMVTDASDFPIFLTHDDEFKVFFKDLHMCYEYDTDRVFFSSGYDSFYLDIDELKAVSLACRVILDPKTLDELRERFKKEDKQC